MNKNLFERNPDINMEAVARCFIKIKRREWPAHRYLVCIDPDSNTWKNELGNKFRIPPDKYSYYTLDGWTAASPEMAKFQFISEITLVAPSSYAPSCHVKIVRTNYEKEDHKNCWAVFNGSRSCLHSYGEGFSYSPLPSSRDEEYLDDHRFNSPAAALEGFNCWINSNHTKRFNPKEIEYMKDNFNYQALKHFIESL